MKTNPFNILTDETFNEKKDIKNNLLRVLAEGEDELIVPDGWDSIQYLIRNNLHSKVFHIGDELICQRDGKEIAWTIIGIDEENIEDPQFNHSLTLQTKDIIDENIPFDVREALFYFSEGLSVGTYYFTIKKQPWHHDDIGKSFMFTLENSIPAGGQLVIQNNYNETCAHSNINSYSSSNSIIPIEEAEMTIWDGETGIFLGNIDIIVQDNINSIERALKGSNNYKESFIRQWLNSNGDMNIIWEPQSIFDRLSSSVDNLQGFMKDLDEDFLRVVKKSNIGTLKKIITKDTTSIGFNSNLELSNYRIYGNTVNGESVGDRTENLWNSEIVNGIISTSGTTLAGISSRLYSIGVAVERNKTYTLSTNLQIRLIFGYKDETPVSMLVDYTPYGIATFTINDDINNIGICLRNSTNTDITPNDIDYCMLNEGSAALPYEPYGYRVPVTVTNGTDTQIINLYLPEPLRTVGSEAEYVDYKEQKQHRVRKNLLQNAATSQIINGVTFTVNDDGSVTCNGTATSPVNFQLVDKNSNPLAAGSYTLSGCPAGGGAMSFELSIFSLVSLPNGVRNRGTSTTFTVQDELSPRPSIIIRSDYSCDNLTFYPMIRKSDIEDDTYEPYIENTELDVDLFALPALSGTNILSVETEVKPSEIYLYQNTIETVKDYFFLPSKMQIYGENNFIQNTEGNFYSYYHNYSSLFEPSDEADINKIKYVEGLSSQWITRTEGNNNSDIYTVTENGELSLIDIDASYGVAPICIVY